ncbi:hypothetical protein JCM8202v2_004782 [Rhodotorula sphaerocarpa]
MATVHERRFERARQGDASVRFKLPSARKAPAAATPGASVRDPIMISLDARKQKPTTENASALSRMTSTRRYLAALEPDDDGELEADRRVSEARSPFDPLRAYVDELVPNSPKPRPSNDSFDPYLYSVYSNLPSGPRSPSPVRIAFEGFPSTRPPSPSGSAARAPALAYAPHQNFSRPARHVTFATADERCSDTAFAGRQGSYASEGMTPYDVSSSIGHGSAEQPSSLENSSHTSHSTHAAAWVDVEAQGVVHFGSSATKAWRDIGPSDQWREEPPSAVLEVATAGVADDPAPEEEAEYGSAIIHVVSPVAPRVVEWPVAPAPSTATQDGALAFEPDQPNSTQWIETTLASLSGNEGQQSPLTHPRPPPSPPVPPAFAPSPSTPLHAVFSADSAGASSTSAGRLTPRGGRPRNVLRKPRPYKSAENIAISGPRSASAASMYPLSVGDKPNGSSSRGLFARLRSRSRNRDTASDAGLWAAECPPMPNFRGLDLASAATSLHPDDRHQLPLSRPPLPRARTESADPLAPWMLKNVDDARSPQISTAPLADNMSARGIVDDLKVEAFQDGAAEGPPHGLLKPANAVRPGHHHAPSELSQYSYYSIPPTPTSPAIPATEKQAPANEHVRKPSSTLSTMQKVRFSVQEKGSQRRRTDERRGPVSPEDFLQLGIKLHEEGELERPGCQADPPRGFRYFQLAAESVVDGIDRVIFGGKTLSEAELNKKAAKSELVLALYEMGVSYRFGWGVARSKPMAVSYFKLAADLGDVDAQQDLAFSYLNGKGCEKSPALAAHYYRAAIAQGASDIGLSWVYKKKHLHAAI